jgi:hypothetical protein
MAKHMIDCIHRNFLSTLSLHHTLTHSHIHILSLFSTVNSNSTLPQLLFLFLLSLLCLRNRCSMATSSATRIRQTQSQWSQTSSLSSQTPAITKWSRTDTPDI